MPGILALPEAARFARARKDRRARKPAEPAPTVAAPSRIPPWLPLLLAGAAVVALFFALRLGHREPWSYDEYYHLGLAREMRAHGLRITTFRWTPFSITHDHFADPEPLFHLLLLPFAGLSLESATLAGVLLGQLFLVGAFAAALTLVRAPRPAWFVLGLAGLGTLFAQRMEMCRPHVWLLGFTVLAAALLVSRRWKALFVVSALFALSHAAAWIAIPLALLWSLSGLLVRGPGEPAEPRFPWQPIAAAAGGWLLGQLLNPDLPQNFRLLWITNFVIPFQATAAGDPALRSQLGTELSPPGLPLLLEQWPALLVAALLAWALLTRPALRTRATLTVGLTALLFLVAGGVAIRRFLELGAPLALFGLALVAREWQERKLPSPLPGWERMAARIALLVAGLWTFAALNPQDASAPLGMAAWLGEHGAPGERVFTAQWGDSAPLFYFAPQLETLVALDPTAFYLKDRRLFDAYVGVVSGQDPDPARTIRERFGARWVTIPPALYPQLLARISHAPGAQALYGDGGYLVVDLGKPMSTAPAVPPSPSARRSSDPRSPPRP